VQAHARKRHVEQFAQVVLVVDDQHLQVTFCSPPFHALSQLLFMPRKRKCAPPELSTNSSVAPLASLSSRAM
jgi:hypothetical protein